jgi:hypothetical protein
MKRTKKFVVTIVIFFVTIVFTGRRFVLNVFAADLPFCGDVDAKIDEKVNCRIEISNSQFEQLNSAHLNIDISNGVTFVVTDADWTCTSTVNNIVCDKVYTTTFPINTFDYVDISFGAGYTGKYDISATVSGSGMNSVDITYNDNLNIPYYVEWCGDGACTELIEDCASCAEDCGACGPVCGDGECNGGEDCESCAEDCGECGPVCGDGECNGEEDCESCAEDCGECAAVCGDGECNGKEDVESCPEDCGS